MDLVAQHLAFANKSGICPVCRRRKRVPWKDGGGLRMTCGDGECYMKWLPGKHARVEIEQNVVPADD